MILNVTSFPDDTTRTVSSCGAILIILCLRLPSEYNLVAKRAQELKLEDDIVVEDKKSSRRLTTK